MSDDMLEIIRKQLENGISVQNAGYMYDLIREKERTIAALQKQVEVCVIDRDGILKQNAALKERVNTLEVICENRLDELKDYAHNEAALTKERDALREKVEKAKYLLLPVNRFGSRDPYDVINEVEKLLKANKMGDSQGE